MRIFTWWANIGPKTRCTTPPLSPKSHQKTYELWVTKTITHRILVTALPGDIHGTSYDSTGSGTSISTRMNGARESPERWWIRHGEKIGDINESQMGVFFEVVRQTPGQHPQLWVAEMLCGLAERGIVDVDVAEKYVDLARVGVSCSGEMRDLEKDTGEEEDDARSWIVVV